MDTKEKIDLIIKNVGGKENIKNAWHCVTRLRFELKDNSKANITELKSIPGVLGTSFAKDQFQVIIGVGVDKYYEVLVDELGIDATAPVMADESEKRKDTVTWFMDVVSGIFGPLVPAIAGAGMIKGLMGGLVALGVITNTTDTYKVIDMLASGVFNFLPFFIAASAAKKFRTNQYLAIAIASILMFPTMVSTAQAGEISAFHILGLIPVPVFNYSGSVIPVIFGVWGLSYIHKWVDKIVPTAAKTVVVPTLTLFISGLFTLLLVGPVGIYCGKGIAWIIGSLFEVSPTLAGIVMGAIRPASILVGMHHAMTPIALENFATLGYDQLMPMMFIANLSIVGAAAACYFKAETPEEKQIVGSSVLSGILGITEPALFGVLTKYKKGFIAATVASIIGSAFIGTFGVRLFGYITSSIFSIPAYIGPWFVYAAIGWIMTLIISFSLSYVLVVKMDKSNANAKSVLKHDVA
ncbi:PTS system, beta-glucosides-specific IIC component [Oribacterium sp. KHPX15]|uniref:PTS transporter subunit EIIC n=1 Tax=Oribacterium sp. KHPX15 TaxID=1855342 RepID=UPI00089D9EC8|nr:PTS transporter subunit EIIC [Oribacterium sp. KHPX15]SEA92893.1 PTS system, beta-glucosides-specific IIC component [Oribacterium sp. KHPX15]